MNLTQLKSAVLRRLKTGHRPTPEQEKGMLDAIDTVLEPMRLRDEKAAERGQAPYNFPPPAVLAYERKTRAELTGVMGHDTGTEKAAIKR